MLWHHSRNKSMAYFSWTHWYVHLPANSSNNSSTWHFVSVIFFHFRSHGCTYTDDWLDLDSLYAVTISPPLESEHALSSQSCIHSHGSQRTRCVSMLETFKVEGWLRSPIRILMILWLRGHMKITLLEGCLVYFRFSDDELSIVIECDNYVWPQRTCLRAQLRLADAQCAVRRR